MKKQNFLFEVTIRDRHGIATFETAAPTEERARSNALYRRYNKKGVYRDPHAEVTVRLKNPSQLPLPT